MSREGQAGELLVVATPIGNLSDLSQRAIEALQMADLVAAEDTRRTLQLLNHLDIKSTLVSYHKFNEKERSPELVRRLEEGAVIALVTDAGTPCISDPGGELVRQARLAGVRVTAVPGPSAVITALSVSGLVFQGFTFLGFLPREKKEKRELYAQMAESAVDTFVLFESPKRLVKSLEELEKELPGAEAFVINDITKYYEASYYGSLPQVIETLQATEKAGLGEYTVVVQKQRQQKEQVEEQGICPEAALVELMVTEGLDLKGAVARLGSREGMRKKQAYSAALRLKELFASGE